jgi:type IV secretory pathway VirB3-like protein
MVGLEKTPLAGGDTRPALVKFIGLPLSAVVVLFMCYGLIMGIMDSWRYKLMALGIMLMVAMMLSRLMRRDHNALRGALLWFQSKALSLDNHKWNGTTIEPFPLRRSKTPRGIP